MDIEVVGYDLRRCTFVLDGLGAEWLNCVLGVGSNWWRWGIVGDRRCRWADLVILEELVAILVDPGMGLRFGDEISEFGSAARGLEEASAEESLVHLF